MAIVHMDLWSRWTNNNEVHLVLDQHAELDSYSASSLKQQSAGRHVAPLGHIILILSQPVFALIPSCFILSEEATHTNFIVFGLTRPEHEPTIYRTRGEHANHYTTDAVCLLLTFTWKIYTFRDFKVYACSRPIKALSQLKQSIFVINQLRSFNWDNRGSFFSKK